MASSGARFPRNSANSSVPTRCAASGRTRSLWVAGAVEQEAHCFSRCERKRRHARPPPKQGSAGPAELVSQIAGRESRIARLRIGWRWCPRSPETGPRSGRGCFREVAFTEAHARRGYRECVLYAVVGLVLEGGGGVRVVGKRSFVDAQLPSRHSMLRGVENSRRESTTSIPPGPVFSTPCSSDTHAFRRPTRTLTTRSTPSSAPAWPPRTSMSGSRHHPREIQRLVFVAIDAERRRRRVGVTSSSVCRSGRS